MLRRYQYAIIVNVVIIMILFMSKPSFLFDINGKKKEFGFSEDGKSILSLYIIIPLISIVNYIIVLSLDAI
jgi:hypothetical protein